MMKHSLEGWIFQIWNSITIYSGSKTCQGLPALFSRVSNVIPWWEMYKISIQIMKRDNVLFMIIVLVWGIDLKISLLCTCGMLAIIHTGSLKGIWITTQDFFLRWWLEIWERLSDFLTKMVQKKSIEEQTKSIDWFKKKDWITLYKILQELTFLIFTYTKEVWGIASWMMIKSIFAIYKEILN